MENITSPGFETIKEPESNGSQKAALLPSDDNLLTDDEYSDEQAFQLKEESNLTEREFMTPGMGNIFEDDAISLPSEDSLYHLDEYFTLRTIPQFRKRH